MIATDKADTEVLKREMKNSPENVKLRLDKENLEEAVTWEKIEKMAPHYSYLQKLDLETLARTNPAAAVAKLNEAANFPNTGNEEKDAFYAAIESMLSPSINAFIFSLDGIYQEECGQPLTINQIQAIMKIKSDLFYHYKKRNYTSLKDELSQHVSCQ